MAPSKAELWDQLSKAIDIIDTAYQFFSGDESTTPNLLTDIDTLQQVFEGNHISSTQAVLSQIRGLAVSIITAGSSLLNAIILELAKIGYDSISADITSAIADIRQGMVDATETITERNFTFGAVAAWGSNVGSGTVYRLTKDKDGYDLENGAADAGITKILCQSDRNTGRQSGAEQFLAFGSGETPTDILQRGDAPDGSLLMQATTASDGKLANASFDTTSGSGATFLVTSWTLSASTSFQKDVANYFRVIPGTSAGQSLEFLLNGTCEQILNATNITIDKTLPVFLILRYYRKTVDGVLTLELGSQTNTVPDLTAVADTTWLDLTVGVDTSVKGWYENWKENDANVKITLASRTTGTLLIDELILAQPVVYDGKYYLITAGATDYIKGDYFTFTDSVVNTGRIQYTMWKMYNEYLPHTNGAPTYADP